MIQIYKFRSTVNRFTIQSMPVIENPISQKGQMLLEVIRIKKIGKNLGLLLHGVLIKLIILTLNIAKSLKISIIIIVTIIILH